MKADDPSTPPQMQEVLYKLAHRMISSAWKPMDGNADRLYLYLMILRQLNMHDEATTLLKSEQGRIICDRSLICDELRRDLMKAGGALESEGELAQTRIVDNG